MHLKQKNQLMIDITRKPDGDAIVTPKKPVKPEWKERNPPGTKVVILGDTRLNPVNIEKTNQNSTE